MSLSQICPKCRAAEVVQEAWTSVCLACGHKQHHGDPTVVPDVDPGVERPVRPGHTLTSNAGAHVFQDNTETPTDESVLLLDNTAAPDVAVDHNAADPAPTLIPAVNDPAEVPVVAEGESLPPAPPSEAPADGQ